MIDDSRSRGALPLPREEQKRTRHRRMRLLVVLLGSLTPDDGRTRIRR
jgi:hypothetical protein